MEGGGGAEWGSRASDKTAPFDQSGASEFNVSALSGDDEEWEAPLWELWDPLDNPDLDTVLPSPLSVARSISDVGLRTASSTIWPVGSKEDLGAPIRHLNLPSHPKLRRLSQDSIRLKPKTHHPHPIRRLHPSLPKPSSSLYAASSLNDLKQDDDPATWPEGSKESLFPTSVSSSASSPSTRVLLNTGYAIGSLEDMSEVGGVWTSVQLFPGSTGLMEMGLKMEIPTAGQGLGRVHADLRASDPHPSQLPAPGSFRPSSKPITYPSAD